MSLRLEARNLTKRYGECVSVNAVSLDFAPGRIHAVLGENGAGKTTLMKLLFGLTEPTSGEVWCDGKLADWRSPMDAIHAGLGMVQQHFTLVDTLSVIDNIMLGAEVCSSFGDLKRDQAIERLENLLPSRNLVLPWHALAGELTVGQKQRLEILKLLFRESKVLFLDEPTAVLAPQEIEEFFTILRQLKAQGRTIVLITHKIGEVMSVCDTFSILRGGELKMRGEVADASVDTIVESMIGRKIPQLEFARLPSVEERAFHGHDLRAGDKLKGVSMHVNRGEIVGIAGVEGAGQSQLVDLMLGMIPFAGELEILGSPIKTPTKTRTVRKLGVGLVPEDRHAQGLWLSESCHTNMAIGLEGRFLRYEIFEQAKLKTQTGAWAREFDVRAQSLDVAVGSLSGGNQQKIIFAREVGGRRPKFLICHQPTRGVDLGAIDLIHRRLLQLRNDGVGQLVVSSELDELLILCDRIYVLFAGHVAAEYQRADFDRMKIGQAMTGVRRA